MEATTGIRELEKEKNLPRTPIIALTANAIKGDRERFLRAGMDEYPAKPISVEALNKVLKKISV
jgi:CheY-like chemotaxis protein